MNNLTYCWLRQLCGTVLCSDIFLEVVELRAAAARVKVEISQVH